MFFGIAVVICDGQLISRDRNDAQPLFVFGLLLDGESSVSLRAVGQPNVSHCSCGQKEIVFYCHLLYICQRLNAYMLFAQKYVMVTSTNKQFAPTIALATF